MRLEQLERARANADRSDSFFPLSSPASNPQPPQVKRERSPSPLLIERRLVTSGTRRFAPVPADCRPPCAGYKQNRLRWVANCVHELEALNLMPERKLVRDDGLVIDWKSHVPVLSDTLKPDPDDLAATVTLAHRSNTQWRRYPAREESPAKPVVTIDQDYLALSPTTFSDPSDVEPLLKKRVPVSPRPSSIRRNNLSQHILTNSPYSGPTLPPCPERLRSLNKADHQAVLCKLHSTSSPADRALVPSDASTRHGQGTVPSSLTGRVYDQPTVYCTSSATEEMTLDYLRRYVQTYEADRASLASAYARSASFAYRVHRVVQNIAGAVSSIRTTPSQCFSSGIRHARLDIVTSLLTLPDLHSDAQHLSAAHIEYDIFYLGADLGMFVVCRVALSTKTVVHNFVLQRKEVDAEDAATDGVWPLTAAAHQILVFQA